MDAEQQKLLEWVHYIAPTGIARTISISPNPVKDKNGIDRDVFNRFVNKFLQMLIDLDNRSIDYKIIAIGALVHKGLVEIDATHFTLPDPAGELPDDKILNEILNRCYLFVHEFGELA